MDRRKHDRFRVWLPVRLAAADGEQLGVSYDVSVSGVRVSCASPLEVGVEVGVTLELPSGAPRTVKGRVLRIGPNEDDPEGLWPHRVVVELDEAIDGLDALLDRMPMSARS